MNNLHIDIDPELNYYPGINFNYKTGVCEISGESYMEEPYEFYEPIIEWLQNYIAEKKSIVLNIRLTYINTSSQRILLHTFFILKKYIETGGFVEITWYYRKDDEDLLAEIYDISSVAGITITAVSF